MTTPKLGFKAQLEANQVSSEAMLCPLDWGRGLMVVSVTLPIIFNLDSKSPCHLYIIPELTGLGAGLLCPFSLSPPTLLVLPADWAFPSRMS